jgi:hypothetical protein
LVAALWSREDVDRARRDGAGVGLIAVDAGRAGSLDERSDRERGAVRRQRRAMSNRIDGPRIQEPADVVQLTDGRRLRMPEGEEWEA